MAQSGIQNRQPKSRLTLEPHQVIPRPLVTEKEFTAVRVITSMLSRSILWQTRP